MNAAPMQVIDIMFTDKSGNNNTSFFYTLEETNLLGIHTAKDTFVYKDTEYRFLITTEMPKGIVCDTEVTWVGDVEENGNGYYLALVQMAISLHLEQHVWK